MNNLPFVFGGIFFVIGAAVLAFGIIQIRKAQTAKTWPTTPGVILSSGLNEQSNYDSEDHTSHTTYEPYVLYRFTLMGQEYQGNHLAIGNASYDYRTASKKIAPYPQGTNVTVHYNPEDPSEAVLEPKSAGALLLFLIGILFAVIGLVVAVVSFTAK
jgi:hypothetical protein